MSADMIFICFLALILFGPKKLPEIGRQIGKILTEFKRASNDFKYQLQSELEKSEKEAAPNPSAPVVNPTLSDVASGTAPTAPAAPPQQNISFVQSLLPPTVKDASSSIDSAHDRLMQTAKLAFEAQNFTLRPPAAPVVATSEPTSPAAPVAAQESASVPAPATPAASASEASAQPQPATPPAESGQAQPS